jgi:hypothetical protein
MVKYNESIFFDRVLYKQDILGSIAFARANAKSGIITQEEFEKIREGLLEVQKEWETDSFTIISGVDVSDTPLLSLALSLTTSAGGHPHCQRAPTGRDHRQEHCWQASHRPQPQ